VLNELALFAGAGGGILGGKLLGWRTVCAVEIEDYPRRVLLQRQNDRILEPFPIWDDVTTFDGKPWRGIVDVVSGGFPCQDISCAGKGEGIDGARSGLWGEMARIISEVRPKYVFVENSPLLVSRGLTTVLGDLAQMGYDARWCVLGADDCGAPHQRKRIWILAYPCEIRCNPRGTKQPLQRIGAYGENEHMANPAGIQNSRGSGYENDREYQTAAGESGRSGLCERRQPKKWPPEPSVGRVVDGLAHRVDRLAAIGNGQVSIVAATAWRILNESQ
jgi:DNA (cytosine-5)-methyltransferase 1